MSLHFQNWQEFDNHLKIIDLSEVSNLSGFIAIHRKLPSFPSFGATRLACYPSEEEALRDTLRLSRLMSFKSVLAGLRCGGAKGVLIKPKNLTPLRKKHLLESYANVVNKLKGAFITGADVGIDNKDLKTMRGKSPFVVGLKSDPVFATALTLFYSLQVALKEFFGERTLKGKTFAIEGAGKIGSGFLKLIYDDASKIYITDICTETLRNIKHCFPKVEIVSAEEIFKKKVDVFSPCAMAGSINIEHLKSLDCKIILGGANNQLENDSVGQEMFERGILYAPDYIVNSGGLISVFEEFENPGKKQAILTKIKKVANTLQTVLALSKRKRLPTNIVANDLAKTILKKYEKNSVVTRI